MEIRQYDRVLLKNGFEASIVEIFGEGACFLADVDTDSGIEVKDIYPDDIEKVIKRAK